MVNHYDALGGPLGIRRQRCGKKSTSAAMLVSSDLQEFGNWKLVASDKMQY